MKPIISDRPIKIETFPPMKEIKQNQKLRELIEKRIEEYKKEKESIRVSNEYDRNGVQAEIDELQKLLEDSKK